ncbi:MAG: YggS family pyridoxal phosphate-dependent enzyme [Halanaerobiales bacterium]
MAEDSTGKELLKRLNSIRERINATAEKAGRSKDDISLIAVSKNQPLSKIDFFQQQDLEIFAESRVQELMEKYEEKADLSWHFIGHLQRNKVKYLMRMDNCKLIHSLDSWRLAREINKRAKKSNRLMPVLLEVNIADDENKYGISPEQVEDFLKDSVNLKNIQIKGLMTIAPYVDNPEEVRPIFKSLSLIKQDMQSKGFENIQELSMGMSNDFEVAIEEGSTMVRIGSALFGKRGG